MLTAAEAVRSESAARPSRLALFVLLALIALLALKCAWVSDDAYITFRVADNLIHGHGLRWNVAERVQAYTNPLWLFAMAPLQWLTGEPYFTSIALGLALTLAACMLLAIAAARESGGLVALLALAGSKAFIDFATSGLESPLLHLMLALAVLAFLRGRTLALALACSGAALTRLDALVLLLPMLGMHVWERRHARPWLALVAGFAPLAAWELFSLAYYGFLFPNTAYAKLSTGLPESELAAQGLRYLANSFDNDPLTLSATIAGVALAAVSRERKSLALAGGIVLHLAYVVEVGGDFMSGRFLTPALFLAAFIIARARIGPLAAIAGAAVVLVLALVPPHGPLRSTVQYSAAPAPDVQIDDSGICDERAYWFGYSGLFSASRATTPPPYKHVTQGHPLAFKLRDQGPKVSLANGIGYFGYWCGPSVFLVDPMGLSDALIARLPIYADGALIDAEHNRFRERNWRIGHFYRHVPEGYVESLSDPTQAIAEPRIAELRARLDLITRGPLWSSQRWHAIASELFGS